MKKIITPNKKINKLLIWSVDVEPFDDVDEVEDFLILIRVNPEDYGFESHRKMAEYIYEFI